MRRAVRTVGAALGIALLAAASGCVREDVRGDTTVYSYDWWVPGAAVAGTVASMAVGWLLVGVGGRGTWSWFFGLKRTGYGLLIGPPVALLIMLPAMFLHSVKVDDVHFEVQHGWWWSLSRHDVRFDDLRQIDVGEEEHRGRRGTSSTYYLDCVSRSGRRERVELDLLMQWALGDIFERAEKRGVAVPQPDEDDADDKDAPEDRG